MNETYFAVTVIVAVLVLYEIGQIRTALKAILVAIQDQPNFAPPPNADILSYASDTCRAAEATQYGIEDAVKGIAAINETIEKSIGAHGYTTKRAADIQSVLEYAASQDANVFGDTSRLRFEIGSTVDRALDSKAEQPCLEDILRKIKGILGEGE